MRTVEAAFDHAFADVLGVDRLFQRWLLSGGRFARHADDARLMQDEQRRARKAAHWWKHWWCRLPDGTESETDIFAVFEVGNERFALHIENKPANGTLKLRQAIDYRRRATLKANNADWLDYSDFETILLAPRNFLVDNRVCSERFDWTISYEDVSDYVPLFRTTIT